MNAPLLISGSLTVLGLIGSTFTPSKWSRAAGTLYVGAAVIFVWCLFLTAIA